MSPKVALITGAARRIGAAIAGILHENGYNVVIHYHTSQTDAMALSQALNAIRANSALALSADLTDCNQVNLLIENIIVHYGQVDVVINNASLFFKTAVGTVTEKEWHALMNIHLKAPFFLSQAAFPYLAKQKGTIINIADIHANRPLRDYSVYSISKAGLTMLTKTLAREFAPEVRVNTISPGNIIWPEEPNALTLELKEKIRQRIALARSGNLIDIAKAALFLIRDAEYITGQDLAVDGGRLLFI